MKTLPMPDDGLGVIGCVRSFSLDGTAWRAFEYRSPINPSTRPVTLILVSADHGHYETTLFPPDWRTMPEADLVRIIRVGPRHSPPSVQRIVKSA